MTRTALYDTTDGDAFMAGRTSLSETNSPVPGSVGDMEFRVHKVLVAAPHPALVALSECEWELMIGQDVAARGKFSTGSNRRTMKEVKMALASLAGSAESPGDFTFGLTHDYVFVEWDVDDANVRQRQAFGVKIHGHHKGVRVVLDGEMREPVYPVVFGGGAGPNDQLKQNTSPPPPPRQEPAPARQPTKPPAAPKPPSSRSRR